jgi:hypothetical protein
VTEQTVAQRIEMAIATMPVKNSKEAEAVAWVLVHTDIVEALQLVVDAACVEILDVAGRRLLHKAGLRFEEHGPEDPRGAAIWDSGCWLREKAPAEVVLP